MKINVNRTINDLKGNPMKVDSDTVLTLRDVLITALMGNGGSDKPPPAATQLKLYTLAQKVQDNDEVEVDAETIVLMKDRIAGTYFPAVGGPAIAILEGVVP